MAWVYDVKRSDSGPHNHHTPVSPPRPDRSSVDPSLPPRAGSSALLTGSASTDLDLLDLFGLISAEDPAFCGQPERPLNRAAFDEAAGGLPGPYSGNSDSDSTRTDARREPDRRFPVREGSPLPLTPRTREGSASQRTEALRARSGPRPPEFRGTDSHFTMRAVGGSPPTEGYVPLSGESAMPRGPDPLIGSTARSADRLLHNMRDDAPKGATATAVMRTGETALERRASSSATAPDPERVDETRRPPIQSPTADRPTRTAAMAIARDGHPDADGHRPVSETGILTGKPINARDRASERGTPPVVHVTREGHREPARERDPPDEKGRDGARIPTAAPTASNEEPRPARPRQTGPSTGPIGYALDEKARSFPGIGMSLSGICARMAFANGKMVDSAAARCFFCGKRGHLRRHCPFDPAPPLPGPAASFVDRLCEWSARSPPFPAVSSLEEAREIVSRTAQMLGDGNPFAGAADSTEFALRKRLAAWAVIGAPRAVLSWLAYGYRLNFLATPPSVGFSNAPGADEYGFFLDEEIPKRVAAGQFAVVPRGTARVINPLNVVPKGSGGYRMILDARFINAFLPDIYFRVENLSAVPTVIPREHWLFTTDLADAYYHVPIHPESRPFLCFCWRSVTYTINVLPFGLGLAPWLFTRVTMPVLSFCRQRGVRVIAYLDDFIWADAAESVDDLADWVRWLFATLGFVVSDKKSQWRPSQCVLFLGLLIDSHDYTFTVPAGRLEKVNALLRSILARVNRDVRVSAREIAKICGHILSMRLAVSPARVYTRALYAVLSTAPAWNARANLTPEAIGELRFWADHLAAFNGRSIIRPASERLLFSDASDVGWGAHVGADASVSAYGLFRDVDAKASSTHRELLGLLYALRSAPIAAALASSRVTFLLDSQAAVWNLAKGGGPVPELSQIVKQIWQECLKHAIDATPEWIRRDRNAAADDLSRYRDAADWQVAPEAFASIERKFGPHTVDRFADRKNRKCERYNSRYFDPDAEAADAFTQRWTEENNYCAPDPDWIDRALALCHEQRAAMTLVFPEWPARAWFRRVMEAAVVVLPLGPRDRVLLPGANSSFLDGGRSNWQILVARVDCRVGVVRSRAGHSEQFDGGRVESAGGGSHSSGRSIPELGAGREHARRV